MCSQTCSISNILLTSLVGIAEMIIGVDKNNKSRELVKNLTLMIMIHDAC